MPLGLRAKTSIVIDAPAMGVIHVTLRVGAVLLEELRHWVRSFQLTTTQIFLPFSATLVYIEPRYIMTRYILAADNVLPQMSLSPPVAHCVNSCARLFIGGKTRGSEFFPGRAEQEKPDIEANHEPIR